MSRQVGFNIDDDSISFVTFAGFFKANYQHIEDISKKYGLSELDILILNSLSEGNFKSTDRIFLSLQQAGHRVDLRLIRKSLSVMRRRNIVSYINTTDFVAFTKKFGHKNI